MPALPDAPNILRATYTGTYGGAKWANVFHLRFTGPTPGQTDLNLLATALATAWGNNLKSLVNSNGSLTNTTVVDLSSVNGLVATDATTIAGTGLGTTALPASVALVCSFKIARRYRGGHPRMYLTGQNSDKTSNQTNWLGTWITTATAGFNAWRVAINALTYTSMPTIALVNLSYYSNKVLRPVPFYDPVSNCIVHSRIDTMRRRLGKEIA